MALRKRAGKQGVSWQIDYLDPFGNRVRESFKKKRDAEAELGKRISLRAENRYLDVKKEYTTTLGELIEKYRENFSWQPGFFISKDFWLKNYEEYFGEKTRVSAIAYVDVEGYRNHLRKKLTKRKTIRRNGSINREMSCLRHLFKKAVSWEMIERSPFSMGDSLVLKENNMRKRFLTEEEIGRLLIECEPKSYLYWIVACALNTGMRRREILTLKWSQIRDGYIYLEKTKTDERREIPINDTLAEMLRGMRKEQGLSSKYVFIFGKKAQRTIQRLDRGFRGALGRAKIEDFRFHDLRHTFASHLVMKGASLKEVQELLGHSTLTMTLRYAHLAEEHKKKAVNLLNGLTASPSRNFMSQNVTNRDSRQTPHPLST